MFTSYSKKTFQSTEEGLDDFTQFKEQEETIQTTATGLFGQIRIFTLNEAFEDDVLGLHVSAKSGQKVAVKKLGKWKNADNIARDIENEAGDFFKNAQEIYDWLESLDDNDSDKPDYKVDDFDSLLKWWEEGTNMISPLRLENKIKEEASLQQRCASFNPRVAPYVYGLNEVYNPNNPKTHFIAMECMDKSLQQILNEARAAGNPSELSDEFAYQLIAICFKLFQHGISHNDLHPGNIMVNSIGRPYLIDFGLAKDNLSPYKTFASIDKLPEHLHRYLRPIGDWSYVARKEKRVAAMVDELYILDDNFPYLNEIKIGLELLKNNEFPNKVIPVLLGPPKSKGGIFNLLGL